MELAYLCRMRGIEVVQLTDAHATEKGLHGQVLGRVPNRGRPVPIRADRRFIILSESGTPLTKAGLGNAWQDLMLAAIEAKVISLEDRFSLHGLKHRGITDTKGTKRKKILDRTASNPKVVRTDNGKEFCGRAMLYSRRHASITVLA